MRDNMEVLYNHIATNHSKALEKLKMIPVGKERSFAKRITNKIYL